MNLYIFNQTRRGALFGVGTYICELTAVLKDSNINVCVVNLTSEKPQIQTAEIDGIKHWYFPSAIPDQRTTSDQKQWETYYRVERKGRQSCKNQVRLLGSRWSIQQNGHDGRINCSPASIE